MRGKVLILKPKPGEKLFKEIISSKPITRTEEKKKLKEALNTLRKQGFFI